MRYSFIKYVVLFGCILSACMQNSKEETDVKPLPNSETGIETITRDSIVPLSEEKIENLKGNAKDSAQMRRDFQLQANAMNLAYKTQKWPTYLNYMLPALVKKLGGVKVMEDNIKKDYAKMAITLDYVKSGPIQSIAAVKDVKGNLSGWYCLMQHESSITTNGQPQVARGYLIGYSPNTKDCYFIDITRVSDDKVFFLMPDLAIAIPNLPRR